MGSEKRINELYRLLSFIEEVCVQYDLRVGQLMFNVFGAEDIFSLENDVVLKRIKKWIEVTRKSNSVDYSYNCDCDCDQILRNS